ncbi:MAG: nucleotidyltransferase substrate binding protein [Marinagarivorans sp.]|nr:nucleotidyltransferase substrate binding protein [Marinagarivorans sp.]
MNYHESRWKQRFQNFSRSFMLLKTTTELEKLSVIERAGMIQFFEISFELAWKVLKDYQEEEGFSISSPRDAIKTAFQYQLIGNGKESARGPERQKFNRTHLSRETAQLVELKIKSTYYPILKDFHRNFTQRLTK